MENKKLKLSKWCHFFVFEKIVAIYHSLSMNIIFMEEKKTTNEKIREVIKDISKGISGISVLDEDADTAQYDRIFLIGLLLETQKKLRKLL